MFPLPSQTFSTPNINFSPTFFTACLPNNIRASYCGPDITSLLTQRDQCLRATPAAVQIPLQWRKNAKSTNPCPLPPFPGREWGRDEEMTTVQQLALMRLAKTEPAGLFGMPRPLTFRPGCPQIPGFIAGPTHCVSVQMLNILSHCPLYLRMKEKSSRNDAPDLGGPHSDLHKTIPVTPNSTWLCKTSRCPHTPPPWRCVHKWPVLPWTSHFPSFWKVNVHLLLRLGRQLPTGLPTSF